MSVSSDFVGVKRSEELIASPAAIVEMGAFPLALERVVELKVERWQFVLDSK